MTNDNFKHPCEDCRVAEEIIEAWEDGLCTANMCDGCFYNEYGCTEDEFYGLDSDNDTPSDCDGCNYMCDYFSLDSGNKCVWSKED